MKTLFLSFLMVLGLATPFVPAFAAETTSTTSTTVTIYNPLGEEALDVRVLIGRVIKGALSIIGSLALLMFIYGGVLWLTSAGNPEMVKKGKEILIWTTLGIVVIFASYAIVSAILLAITSGSVTGTVS